MLTHTLTYKRYDVTCAFQLKKKKERVEARATNTNDFKSQLNTPTTLNLLVHIQILTVKVLSSPHVIRADVSTEKKTKNR